SMNTYLTDRILSLGDPSRIVNQRPAACQSVRFHWGTNSGPLIDMSDRGQSTSDIEKNSYISTSKNQEKMSEHHEQLSIPPTSLKSLPENGVNVASSGPGPNSTGRQGFSASDYTDHLEKVEKMEGDPVTLYSNFEIEVERAKYTVKFYGIDANGVKNELFSCKAGLGSSEYPTPQGSFYITRIFDDKPLWIPPQDRDWAYGQAASNSVYGGRMMPFFKKLQAAAAPKSDDINSELDMVAPCMKMVDTGTYRIHGTNSPWSVGSAQSHGCVRLLNASVVRLADTLKTYVGTTTRGQTENGVYINLARPVRLVLH
ncbi:MAG: L,D-transpeptidase, partial [Desulfomonilaceae bacterium]